MIKRKKIEEFLDCMEISDFEDGNPNILKYE